MMMFHLGEEVSTVARSVAVFPVEVADRATIGRLQDKSDNHYEYIEGLTTFHILDPSSAVTPSQIVLPLFCFALHTWGLFLHTWTLSFLHTWTLSLLYTWTLSQWSLWSGGLWWSHEEIIQTSVDLIIILRNIDNFKIFLFIPRNHQSSAKAAAMLFGVTADVYLCKIHNKC